MRPSDGPDRGRPRPADAIDRLRAAAGPIETDDARGGGGFRDLWDVTPRLQLDLDLRLDGYERRRASRRRRASACATRSTPTRARPSKPAPAGSSAGRRSARRRSASSRRASIGPSAPPTGAVLSSHTYLPVARCSSCREPTASPSRSSARSGRELEVQATVRARDGAHLPTRDGRQPRRRRGARERRRQRVPASSRSSVAPGVERRRAAVRQLRARVVARRVERLRLDVHQPRRAAARAERHAIAGHRRSAAPAARLVDVHAAARVS